MRDANNRQTMFSIVTVIDAHSAVIDRFTGETLVHIRTIVAPSLTGTSDHMGDSPHRSYHSGTRGETATAARQRAHERLRRKFIASVADAVGEAAASAEWIVLGGAERDARSLERALAKSAVHPPVIAAPLHRGLSAKLAIDVIVAAIAAERDSRNLAAVDTLLERTGAHTTGVVGEAAVSNAADRGSAGVIFMTRHFQNEHAAAAERLATSARAHRALVVTVANAAADLLDANAGGVGAMLRYAPYKAPIDASRSAPSCSAEQSPDR